ncbi:MAG: hypothetical protein JXQ76_01065 [Campylobacterales bacterium]|nr:hypothetical protein [Campylobacterales bacterium]
MAQNQEEGVFQIVHKSRGKSKDKSGIVTIETAMKGLVYRTNVYLNDFLIDAKEVSCIDLASLENGSAVFKQRYLATHKSFEQQYFMDKVFANVLTTKGDYIQGEGECVVNTLIFENIIKTEVIVDEYEVDSMEVEVEPELVEDKVNFKRKYTKLHHDMVKENIIVPKFPVNTFLNPILKKFPFYKSSPMKAFFLFLVTVALVLWIVSKIICGKAIVKIVKAVGGKEASFVVKDMQKGMCVKGGGDQAVLESEKKELIYDKLYKDGYLILPEKVEFQDNSQIKTIYVKNTLDGDLIVTLNNKIVDNLESTVVTAEMLIRMLTPTRIILKPGEIGSFEFKIEKSFLQNSQIVEGPYTGKLIFEVIKVRYNQTMLNAVTFGFNVTKDQNTTKE